LSEISATLLEAM